MDYDLIISERADQLFENCLRRNPYQFPKSRDLYLQRQGYMEAVYSEMDYLIVFHIEDRNVYIFGVFHQLEEYRIKLR